jgi:hypothetical protein
MGDCEATYKEYEEITIANPFPVGNPADGVKFKLRGLTDEESAVIVAMAKKDDYEAGRASDRKGVFYALGGKTKLGEEGWSLDGPVDLAKIDGLRPEAMAELTRGVILLTYPGIGQLKN